jgi:hypothetical protein
VLWVEYASTYVPISFSAQFHPPNCVGSARKGINLPIPSRQPVNGPFLDQGGRPDQFRAALVRAISKAGCCGMRAEPT